MEKRCMICDEIIEEDYGKLNGTILKVKDENSKTAFIHVCSDCQKQDKWVETAKIRGV